MLIGDRQSFAIECYHEPIPNETKRVFGRMCIWIHGVSLGDIEEPACMLNVTEKRLITTLERLESLHDDSLANLPDHEAFAVLNHAIYLDDDRSTEAIIFDARRYFKFDFLTNGGESFDRTKSFIINTGENVRILFTDCSEKLYSAIVPKNTFIEIVTSFLAWLRNESKNAG